VTHTDREDKEMRSEYDFSASVRGKHSKKMPIAGSDPGKFLFLCVMLSKIWVNKALECTFGCPKGAFKQGQLGSGHSGSGLAYWCFGGGKVYPVVRRLRHR